MREYLDLLRITSRASQSVQTCSDDAVTGDSFVLQGTVKPSPRGSNIEKSTPLYRRLSIYASRCAGISKKSILVSAIFNVSITKI